MKNAKQYLEEANESVPRITGADALSKYGDDKAVFIDVRDSADIDESMPFHNPVMNKDADLYLVCGAGGQAALAGKTLKEMGYASVTNIGGIGEWKDAGGAMED